MKRLAVLLLLTCVLFSTAAFAAEYPYQVISVSDSQDKDVRALKVDAYNYVFSAGNYNLKIGKNFFPGDIIYLQVGLNEETDKKKYYHFYKIRIMDDYQFGVQVRDFTKGGNTYYPKEKVFTSNNSVIDELIKDSDNRISFVVEQEDEGNRKGVYFHSVGFEIYDPDFITIKYNPLNYSLKGFKDFVTKAQDPIVPSVIKLIQKKLTIKFPMVAESIGFTIDGKESIGKQETVSKNILLKGVTTTTISSNVSEYYINLNPGTYSVSYKVNSELVVPEPKAQNITVSDQDIAIEFKLKQNTLGKKGALNYRFNEDAIAFLKTKIPVISSETDEGKIYQEVVKYMRVLEYTSTNEMTKSVVKIGSGYVIKVDGLYEGSKYDVWFNFPDKSAFHRIWEIEKGDLQ